MFLRNFVLISPWKSLGPFIWKKLESPLPKDALWFWRRRFLKICQCIFGLLYLSPLGKVWDPSFEKTWIPFAQGCFVPSLFEIGPVVLEKMKMWKDYYNKDNDDGQRTNFDQKSSLEPLAYGRWAKNKILDNTSTTYRTEM